MIVKIVGPKGVDVLDKIERINVVYLDTENIQLYTERNGEMHSDTFPKSVKVYLMNDEGKTIERLN
jgi:hypothetical protein